MKPASMGTLLGAAGIALAAGGFMAGRLTAPPPEGYLDISKASDATRKLLAMPEALDLLGQIIQVKDGEISMSLPQQGATALVMPDRYPRWPSALALSAPREGMHWIGLPTPGLETLPISNEKWTIVNLWATWCAPCVVELPDFNRLAHALGDKADVFVINADTTGKDTPAAVRAMFADKGYDAIEPIVVSHGALDSVVAGAGMSRSRVTYPMTVIFAPGGKPFAYVQDSAADWQSGESGWATPGMIAFFEKLPTLPPPG